MADYNAWSKEIPADAFRLTDATAPSLEAERGEVYGDPLENHRRIADLWSVWFGHKVRPSDVAMAMVLVKQSRLVQTPDHADSIDDGAVYLDFYRRFVAAGE